MGSTPGVGLLREVIRDRRSGGSNGVHRRGNERLSRNQKREGSDSTPRGTPNWEMLATGDSQPLSPFRELAAIDRWLMEWTNECATGRGTTRNQVALSSLS